MSTFEQALEQVLAYEGGYGNDPDDAGSETYRGISRRFHPSWSGWSIVDGYKGHPQFPTALDQDANLQAAVRAFYRKQYWDRFQGDELQSRLAAKLLDIAVNMGVHRAVQFLQQGLNLLNRNQTSWPDLVEDGLLGPATLGALQVYIRQDPPEVLLKVLNILQGAHYLDYMRRSPVQEKFARGWLARVAL